MTKGDLVARAPREIPSSPFGPNPQPWRAGVKFRFERISRASSKTSKPPLDSRRPSALLTQTKPQQRNSLMIMEHTTASGMMPPRRPPTGKEGCCQDRWSYPLITKQAALALGISLRALYSTLNRYQHVVGIVEKHGRKNLFYPENLELIRKLRRADSSAASLDRYKKQMAPQVNVDFDRVLEDMRSKRKGSRNV